MGYHADMIRIGGNERIEGFGRPDVFRVGIMTANWPEVGGLVIRPQDELVVAGTRIDVGMRAAGLAIHIDGQVAEYVRDELVMIEGRSSLAYALVGLNLADAPDGADVSYEVVIEPRKLHVRLAEVAIRQYLQDAVPRFAANYRDNVEAYLHAELDLAAG